MATLVQTARLHTRIRVLFASTVVLGATFPTLVAQTIEKMLPPETVMTFFVNDLEAYQKSARTLPFAKILAEPEVQKFLEKPKNVISEAIASLEQRIRQEKGFEDMSLDPNKLMSGAYGRAFVAITHVDVESSEIPDIGFIFGIERRQGAPDWLGLLKEGITRIASTQGAQDVRFEAVEEEGVSFEILRDQHEARRIPFCVADHNGIQLLSISKRSMIRVLHLATSEGPSLATSASWKTVRAQLGESRPDTLQAYFDTQACFSIAGEVMDLVSSEAPELATAMDSVSRVLDRSGFRDIGPMLLVEGAKDGVSESRLFAASKDPAKGLMKAFCPKQEGVDLALLKSIPENSASFSIFQIDPAAIYDFAFDALKEIDPAAHEQAVSMLDSLGTEAAGGGEPIRLREDLCANLGPTIVVITPKKPSMMQTVPPMLFVADARNGERLLTALDQALEFVGKMVGQPVKIQREDRKTYVLHQIDLGGQFSLVRPAYTFSNGLFYFATEPGLVKQHLKRLEKGDVVDITSNPDYQRFAVNLPDKGVTALGYGDTRYAFESMYDMVISMFPIVSGAIDFELPIDLEIAPMRETISQHLFGSFSYSQRVPGGSLTVSYSPIGVDAMILGVGSVGVLGGFLAMKRFEATGGEFDVGISVAPSGSTSRSESHEDTAMSDMNKLSSHIALYRLELGSSPSTLDDLKKSISGYENGVWSGDLPVDPWGHPYHYVAQGESWRLWSSGPDGRDDQGTGDDIVRSTSSK